jgi:hypothetical protein
VLLLYRIKSDSKKTIYKKTKKMKNKETTKTYFISKFNFDLDEALRTNLCDDDQIIQYIIHPDNVEYVISEVDKENSEVVENDTYRYVEMDLQEFIECLSGTLYNESEVEEFAENCFDDYAI